MDQINAEELGMKFMFMAVVDGGEFVENRCRYH